MWCDMMWRNVMWCDVTLCDVKHKNKWNSVLHYLAVKSARSKESRIEGIRPVCCCNHLQICKWQLNCLHGIRVLDLIGFSLCHSIFSIFGIIITILASQSSIGLLRSKWRLKAPWFFHWMRNRPFDWAAQAWYAGPVGKYMHANGHNGGDEMGAWKRGKKNWGIWCRYNYSPQSV